MIHVIATTARLLAGVAVTLTVATACGGRSIDDNAGAAAAASGGAQHEAGNGSGARGGRPNMGGSSAGGSSSAGGTLGIAWPKECSDPPESGFCNAYFERWYLDIATGICTPFVYGGCDGNDNNYESLAACQEACPSTNPSYDHCKVAPDCMLAAPGCCGVCDGPEVRAHALIAYAKQYETNVRQTCGGTTCGGCAELPTTGGQLQYFVPDCVNQQCVVTDIRMSQITACANDQDCFLRSGTRCCDSCDSTALVAISNFELLAKLVCGADEGCPDIACNPAPNSAIAYCDAGHCAVKRPTL